MTSTIETLRRDFSGDIIGSDSDDYPTARRSVLVAGSPTYILRPRDVAGVQAAVRFAVEAGLALAVRGGGHSFAGLSTNDGGIVVDLREIGGVDVVDAARHVVRVGGGTTWGQVASVLAPLGLAISSGDTKAVGVGGLTLSGGIGWKVRKHGLALDNLVAAEVVTANGELVRASAEENAELFWALRGGGGNFGIVTAFEFVAHPTTEVFFGKIAFPANESLTVLQGWADYLRSAPDELSSVAGLANPFAGGPSAPVEIFVAFDGDDPDAATRAIDGIRRLGTVIADEIEVKPYADILEDGMVPPPEIRVLTHSGFVERESVPDALRMLADIGASEGSPYISIRSVGGAASRVPGDATAYAHRDAELMVATLTAGPEPVIEAARPVVEGIWRRLAPHMSGAYANFLASATEEDVAAVYPPNTYRRLAAVKRRYDPDNVFASTHNVLPG